MLASTTGTFVGGVVTTIVTLRILRALKTDESTGLEREATVQAAGTTNTGVQHCKILGYMILAAVS